jgi:hypothetical protein
VNLQLPPDVNREYSFGIGLADHSALNNGTLSTRQLREFQPGAPGLRHTLDANLG